MLAPPPEPPRPNFSPPEGDSASEPLPLPGIATLEPGWDEITTPAPPPVPLSPLGGARTDPASPRPEPFLPEVAPIVGGGGTTLARIVPGLDPPEFPALVEELRLVPEPATDGGGGMMFDAPRDEP